MGYRHVEELLVDWRERRTEIERRLREFRAVGRQGDEALFEELAFCLFAVQTAARRSDAAVRDLAAAGLIMQGSRDDIALLLRRHVRFHNHKAAHLVDARGRFFGGGDSLRRLVREPPSEARTWLVREISGLGFKEASHFLRNVGRGDHFAILDRHVLRNLRRHGVYREAASLTPKRYLAVEGKVRVFSDVVDIPMAALDLVFWSRETGEVFK